MTTPDERKWRCKWCKAWFVTESEANRHAVVCGMEFEIESSL